jgi:hypothetical protein
MADGKMRIAILLLNNFGDIIYATPIAKQIKEIDFPECHLIWIVSKQCADILKGNPNIDQLEIVDLISLNEIYLGKWQEIEYYYTQKVESGEYDKLFVLQPYEKNFLRYKDSIRKMILDAYPHQLKFPINPLVYLSEQEKNNVNYFIEQNNIYKYKHRVLFEFAPSSGQSNLTFTDAIKIAEEIVIRNESTCIIMTSRNQLLISNKNIFNAQGLSFKENAELINQCTLLLGCSSGISWLSTSLYCKTIPVIQFLDSKSEWFNSLKADFLIHKINDDNLLELYVFDIPLIVETVSCFLDYGIKRAKFQFDQKLEKRFQKNIHFSISNYFFRNNYYKL